MNAGLVIIESRPALVLAGTLGTLEGGGLSRTAEVVVLHASNTAALELTLLEERGRDSKAIL